MTISSNIHPGLNLGESHGKGHTGSETVVFGFWVFLMSDLINFGVLFATYIGSTTKTGMAGGAGPAELFDITSVALQTAFLLASSLTCGLASLALKYNEGSHKLVLWLLVTAAFGVGFLVFELLDFSHMFAEGATPMRSSWLSSFYALVGLHGLHIAVGLLWLTVMLALIYKCGLTDRNKTRLLMFALYWHFLDVVWIWIFSIVFLGGLT